MSMSVSQAPKDSHTPSPNLSRSPSRLGCDDGLWGEDCTGICVCPLRAEPNCDQVTGKCLCKPGWRGQFCNKRCPKGYFGRNCRNDCTCANNGTCHHIYGTCDCLPGWTGVDCHLECPPHTFGKNCGGNCTCSERMVCDAVAGNCTCPIGGGGAPQCQPTSVPRIHSEKDLILSGLVGGLIVAIILCSVIVVTVLVVRRKRQHVLGFCEELKLRFCWRRKTRKSLTNNEAPLNYSINNIPSIEIDDTWSENSSSIYATVASNWTPGPSSATEPTERVSGNTGRPEDVFYFVLDGPARPYDKLDHTGKTFQQPDKEFEYLQRSYGHLITSAENDDNRNDSDSGVPYDRIVFNGDFATRRPLSNSYDIVENINKPS